MERLLELAWLAGIVDGEGSICIVKSRQSYRLTLAVCMTHEPTVNKVYKLFGAGSVSHLPKEDDKDAWTWHVAGGEAVFIIKSILPYLFTKRHQAELAIEFGENCLWEKRIGEYVPIKIEALRAVLANEMCILNKRGK